MPIELRELIIQARIDPPDSADAQANRPKLTAEERQEIIDAVLERLEHRLAETRDR